MDIQIAKTTEELRACVPVLRELRPGVAEDSFVSAIRRQQAAGYLLVYAAEDAPAGDGTVVAVAGVRIGENLAWGRYLYVDDLVTRTDCRSRGHGSALLTWLEDFARGKGCGQIHLDSGAQRRDAHRFYHREGFEDAGIHFIKAVAWDLEGC